MLLCPDLGWQFFWDNVAKESHARYQSKTTNKIHLMALGGAAQNRIGFGNLSDALGRSAKVYYNYSFEMHLEVQSTLHKACHI